MKKARIVSSQTTSATIQQTCVVYIRVSSKEQQQEGFSLDSQLKFLNDYARSKGMQIVHTYMDVESAKAAGRTEFGNLVEFLRQQQLLPSTSQRCQTVLVEKTDRFYRNVQDLVTVRDLGVEVHLVKEGVVMTPAARSHEKFVHGLNVLLAERMVNNLSEETQKGMLEKAQQGIWPSQAPIGFVNVEGPNRKRVIIQDPGQASLVRRLFETYADGIYSLKDACKLAADLGLRHRRSGNKLTKSALHDLLNNPIYYGDFYWKGLLYNGCHEPIVSKELYDKVQAALNKRSSCPTGRQKHDFLLQGLLNCGYCGCAVVAEQKKNRYVYYHCTGNKGVCPGKTGKYSREEVLDQQFADSLYRLQLDGEVVDWISSVMNENTDAEQKQMECSIAELEKNRKRLEDRLEKMYLDKLDGVLGDDEYKRLSNKFRSELTDIKFSIERLRGDKQVQPITGKRILELAQKAASLYSGQISSEKRKLLLNVYSNSTLAGGTVTPNFKQPFNMIAITNDEYQQKKATSGKESDLLDIWRPRDDSNVRPTP